MKKIFTSMFALATLLTANAQMASGVQARVYAYDLQQEQSLLDDGVNTYAITFKTNCAANEGKVILLQDGEPVYEVAATSTDGKNWTAKVDVYALQEAGFTPEAGTYNWSVEVSAGAINEFGQISDENSKVFSFYRSYCVAVDNSPESDYFGRVYVVNQTENTANKDQPKERYTENGIYTLKPTLESEGYHAVAFIGDVNKRGDSANDMTITADGRIFISNMTTDNAGIYYVNPETFEFTKTNVSSPIAGIGSYGYGKDTQLYGIDMTNSTNGVINRYDIGNDNTLSENPTIFNNFTKGSTSITIQGKTYSTSYTTGNSIDPVSTGFWVSQYMTNSRGSKSALFYCNNDGAVKWGHEFEGINTDWDSSTQDADGYIVSDNRNGALAVNEDLGLVAFVYKITSSIANVRIFNYRVNANGTLSTTFIGEYPMTEQKGRSNAMSFDYAGNLYSVNEGAEDLTVYAIPTDNNTCTTPAKSSLAIELTDQDITTGIVEVGVDADAAVEYYNLQGVKVVNPSNGIFIKKQGNKTTKVVL